MNLKNRVADLETKRTPKGMQAPVVNLGLTISTLSGETIEQACKRRGIDYKSLTRSRPLEELPKGAGFVNVTLHKWPKEADK